MKLEEIKQAIEEGKKVYWKHDNYQVIKGKYEYMIECLSNKHCIGLTHKDGLTMNGDDQDFYMEENVKSSTERQA